MSETFLSEELTDIKRDVWHVCSDTERHRLII